MSEEIFEQVVRLCIKKGLITGKLLLADSTYVRANARNDLYETITVADEPSAYLQRLNEQAVAEGLSREVRPISKADICAALVSQMDFII